MTNPRAWRRRRHSQSVRAQLDSPRGARSYPNPLHTCIKDAYSCNRYASGIHHRRVGLFGHGARPHPTRTSEHRDCRGGQRQIRPAGRSTPTADDGPRLTYVPQADAIAADCDVAFLATPAEVSLELAPQLLAKGRRVIDLSGAFRLPRRGALPEVLRLRASPARAPRGGRLWPARARPHRQRERATHRQSRLLRDRDPARTRAASL